ncbi:MAG: pyridoxamine 5'-phosphate oxidase family protein [Bacillota bacterium]
MTLDDAKREALSLVVSSRAVVVACNGQDGYPYTKAMFKMEHDGLKTVWFSTNTSSQRVAVFQRDPRASLYFMDAEEAEGVMLVGEMEILDDLESRKRIWREGYERYYPLGVSDPDYSVLRFTARWGRYYHNLQTVSFEIS